VLGSQPLRNEVMNGSHAALLLTQPSGVIK
jgi:hypothetical protein